MRFLIARFGEPSTYGALAAMLAALGLHLDPGVLQSISLVGTGITGLLGVMLRDKGSAA